MNNDKNKYLVIITYDMNRGAWLENELVYHYNKGYKKIFVFNTCADVNLQGRISQYAECYVLTYTLPEMLGAVVRSLSKKMLWEEVNELIKSRRFNYNNLRRAWDYLASSIIYANKVDCILCENNVLQDDNIIFYSYWLSVQAESLLHLKSKYQKSKFISRCHRVDIYEEEEKNGYIEYRKALLGYLDFVYCISEHGRKYIEEKYNCLDKCKIAYLGSISNECQFADKLQRRDVLKIVSCSTITPVKRVEYIADAISRIKDIPIIWHHYGDGPLRENVSKLLKDFPKNITCELKGNVPHEELMERYIQEKYDLFVMASTSEGIPVSIMEAMALGMPVLATDVGGVSEIVYNEVNGILLSADAPVEKFVDALKKFALMDEQCYESMEKHSSLIWKSKYDARVNFSKFADDLVGLLN